jgi:SAM-dependent methyltransferase
MSDLPDKSTFASLYSGQVPWDIGKPQTPFIDVADRITGSVLDAGCGTGDNALFFADRACTVTGIDFLEEPIKRAQRKAAERGLPATFLVKDALTLKDWSERFDAVIDSGLFHVFDDHDRCRYVEGLATVLEPGGGCSCSASATMSRGRRDRGGCQRRNCTPPSPRAGASSSSSRPATRSGPI